MSSTKNMVIDHLNNQREKKASYKQGWKEYQIKEKPKCWKSFQQRNGISFVDALLGF